MAKMTRHCRFKQNFLKIVQWHEARLRSPGDSQIFNCECENEAKFWHSYRNSWDKTKPPNKTYFFYFEKCSGNFMEARPIFFFQWGVCLDIKILQGGHACPLLCNHYFNSWLFKIICKLFTLLLFCVYALKNDFFDLLQNGLITFLETSSAASDMRVLQNLKDSIWSVWLDFEPTFFKTKGNKLA